MIIRIDTKCGIGFLSRRVKRWRSYRPCDSAEVSRLLGEVDELRLKDAADADDSIYSLGETCKSD